MNGSDISRGKEKRRADTEESLGSVVIPCYNQAHFLGEAIESVLSQSYPHHEIVVVDDGSTDNTSEVASRYPEVRLIRQENRGLSGARNRGLAESRGEYVVFLDSDDRLLPGALEVGARELEAHPECAFVSGHYRFIKTDGSFLEQPQWQTIGANPYLSMLRGEHNGMHATVMYRRSVFESVGRFDISLRACEDYDLYLRIARRFPVCQHDRVVAEYRQHGANMTGNPALMLSTSISVLRAQWEHVKGNEQLEGAYKEGMRFWRRDCYGYRLVDQVRAHAQEQEWEQALGGTLVLLRYYPLGLASLLPRRMRHWLRAMLGLFRQQAPVGRVRFGNLRRVTPISREFGYDRGLPVDRYYIENFLARHSEDVRGRVLEVGDDSYTRRFGGGRVSVSDVLHVAEGNPQATIVADLARADHIPSNAFDCVVLTQTLHLIYDARSAIQTLHRILRPGGVLLATFPGISKIDKDQWGDRWYWAFTSRSARRLFEEVFPAESVRVEAHGNVFAAIAFLHGMATEELRREELEYRDPSYEVLITLRAVKPGATPSRGDTCEG